jgi:hypothetical protein
LASFSSANLKLSSVFAFVTVHFSPVSSSKIERTVFCVVVKEAILRYRFAVSAGCFRIDAMASPIVPTFVQLNGSFPESKMVAVFLGREIPSEPTLRPYEYSSQQMVIALMRNGRTQSKNMLVDRPVHENQVFSAAVFFRSSAVAVFPLSIFPIPPSRFCVLIPYSLGMNLLTPAFTAASTIFCCSLIPAVAMTDTTASCPLNASASDSEES